MHSEEPVLTSPFSCDCENQLLKQQQRQSCSSDPQTHHQTGHTLEESRLSGECFPPWISKTAVSRRSVRKVSSLNYYYDKSCPEAKQRGVSAYATVFKVAQC